MDIHEYQAKEILAKYGVPIPRGLSRAHLRHWAGDAVSLVTARGAGSQQSPVRLTPSTRPSAFRRCGR